MIGEVGSNSGLGDGDSAVFMAHRHLVLSVARCHQGDGKSDDDNGVRFARYEREIAGGRGDEYSEVYVGLNYYWYGHKLKLQTGLQYANMDDRAADGGAYSGWAWTTGFRISW